jgi:hypothetical protein
MDLNLDVILCPVVFYCRNCEESFAKKVWIKHKKEHRMQAHKKSFNSHKACFSGLQVSSTSNLPETDVDNTFDNSNYNMIIDIGDIKVDIEHNIINKESEIISEKKTTIKKILLLNLIFPRH